jgi:hypothetical protein
MVNLIFTKRLEIDNLPFHLNLIYYLKNIILLKITVTHRKYLVLLIIFQKE